MPEKVTKEEKIVDLAIAKARKTIETLRESTQVIPYDSTVEVQKIKRPKKFKMLQRLQIKLKKKKVMV